MERSTVEMAIKTEIDQEHNKKEWASLVGLCQKHKPQHPHHVKVINKDKQKVNIVGVTFLLFSSLQFNSTRYLSTPENP